MQSPPKPPTSGQIVALVGAALVAGATFGGIDLDQIDFGTFYDAAGVPTATAPDQLTTARPNLNPPTFNLMMAPFRWLPKVVAFGVWTAISAAALIASIAAIRNRLRLSPYQLVWVAIACVGFMPFALVWAEGQVTFLLMYLVTRAWLSSTSVKAGVWLGFAIALKPPLALMALVLAPTVWLAAGAVSLGITVAVVAVTGWAPWVTWLEVGRQVSWVGWPLGLSLWSIPARIEAGGVDGVRMQDLSMLSVALGVCAAAVTFVVAVRAAGHRRWALALLWSLFVSPAGWLYYIPIGLGPMLASWPRTWPTTAALICWSVPMPLLAAVAWMTANSAVASIVVGSVYTIGGFAAWSAWSRQPKT